MASEIRVTRGATHVTVVDVRLAGKRGKVCDETCLYDLDYARDRETAESLLEALAHVEDYATAVAILHGVHALVSGVSIHSRTRKSIAVAPAGFTPIVVQGKFTRIEADWDDFVVRDLVDTNNLPTAIPPVRGSKLAAAKAFRSFLGKNCERLGGMRFHEILDAMCEAGLKYHDYCAMD